MKSKQYKNYWYLDLLGMISSGLAIGYERQLFADSGEFNQYRITQSILISSLSYLIVFLVFLKFNKSQKARSLPGWVLMAITGAITCFFSLHVVKFALDNWQYRKSDS